MKKVITIAIVIITIIAIFFIKNNYKSFKFGNNISNKSAEEIAEYILDINSYELTANITVESNKNTNIYTIKEKYIKDDNIFKQEIIEPQNLNGISFIYDGSNLKLQNSNLNLTKIYENYPYIGENTITLMGFIEDYMEAEKTKISENDGQIIIELKLNISKLLVFKLLL